MEQEFKFYTFVTLLLKVLDTVLTYIGLIFFPIEEGNPIMKIILDKNIYLGLFFSFFVTLLIVYFINKIEIDYVKRHFFSIVNTILLVVVVINLVVIYGKII